MRKSSSIIRWSCDLTCSNPSPGAAPALPAQLLGVPSAEERMIFSLILQGCQGSEASSPHCVEQPSLSSHSLPLGGFAVLLLKSQKWQVCLLLVFLACTVLIAPCVHQLPQFSFGVFFPTSLTIVRNHALHFCVLIEKGLPLFQGETLVVLKGAGEQSPTLRSWKIS